MKFTQKWKNFWQIQKHTTGGFTLVELIVVIAILAILAGIGVPAYSGYITKANKQADMTLISEIEHALTLAGYNGTFDDGESGYVILSVDGISGIEEGSSFDEAMKATFGTGYMESLKLKHDGWGSSGLINGLTPDMANAVALSSYMTGNRVDSLLGDVERMTGMAVNLVDALAAGGGALSSTTLSDMFSYKDADGNVVCVLDETAAQYGISKDDNETWEDWAAKSEGNQTAYSNLLVLAAADESEKYMTTLGQEDAYVMSSASNMILEFSSFYAFAATNADFSATLDTYLAHLNNEATVEGVVPVTDSKSGSAWYNALKAEANAAGYSTYEATMGEDNGQGLIDQFGFLSIMAGLGNPTDEQADIIAADLSNANLFTNGIVNDMYNEYLDTVDAISGLYDENGENNWSINAGEGEIAILVVQGRGKTTIVDSLPTV